jgi:MFS transporter, DHA1 family, multidrug resistance protein
MDPVTAAPTSRGTRGTAATTGHLTRRRYTQLVLVLGALIALGPLTIDMYLPAFPRIAQDLGATDSAVQLTLTGMLLGLAGGQLVIGPLSDALGRRRPLLVGIGVHALASLACAMSPTIGVLAAVRVLQGFAGAAVSVVAMAIVRDLFEGVAVARIMSRLMLVIGLAPILAPSLGGLVLTFSTWRGIFVVLAGAAVLLCVLAMLGLRETLPVERRRPATVRATLSGYRSLLADRVFVALAFTGGSMMAAMFAYVSGASFVLQDGFGLDERTFGLLFGVGAVGLIASSQVNVALLRRFSPGAILSTALIVAALAGAVMLFDAVTGTGGLLGIMIPIWVVLAMVALCGPNATALALAEHGQRAGAAAALLGAAQFVVGAVVAPLTGLGEAGSAVPMAATIAGALLLAAVLVRLVLRPAPAVAIA